MFLFTKGPGNVCQIQNNESFGALSKSRKHVGVINDQTNGIIVFAFANYILILQRGSTQLTTKHCLNDKLALI